MRLPVIRGMIKRRLLVNFCVDAATMQKFLPAPFRPKLHAGYAVAGICLIRLEQIRPVGVPSLLGISSENAAHRIAVLWDDEAGLEREGVFIPRRDTGSHLNHLAGGRVFPGEHSLAKFEVNDDGRQIDFNMRSSDGLVSVQVRGADADTLPTASCFGSLAESSKFFEGGCVGYSVTRDACRLDGIRLRTLLWQVRALNVQSVASSFFSNEKVFPAGTVEFDHALIMRDVPHEWHMEADMRIGMTA
jgi:hypothetical protein